MRELSTVSLLSNFGLVGATVGIALGTAGLNLIQAFTSSILMPTIGLVINHKDLKDFTINFRGVDFGVGNVVHTLLEFLITLVIIFFTLRYFLGSLITDVIDEKGKHEGLVRFQNEKMIHHLSKMGPGPIYHGIQPTA